MAKPVGKQFDFWTYTDEITGKGHNIRVATMKDGDAVLFMAEVNTPVRFVDQDENYKTLKARVMARCAEGVKLEWTPYILVTIRRGGFEKKALEFSPLNRNDYDVGILYETFEVATLLDGSQIWRGIAGKSQRFGAQAKPGWPETGKTDRGGTRRYFADTPENREMLEAMHEAFAGVGRLLKNAIKTKNVKATWNTLCGYTEQWNSFDEVIRKQSTPDPDEETACPESASSSA